MAGPLKIAFSTLASPDWGWHDVLRHGPEYGYDGVEIRLLNRETDLLQIPELAEANWDARRRDLDDAGFRVCGLASSVHFDDDESSDWERQIEIGRKYIEMTRALGGEFVRVFGDVLPDAGDAAARRARIERVAEGLQRLGEHAAEREVAVLLETHGDFTDTHPVAETLALVESPAVGVVWDTHHPWRFCGEPIAESFERIGRWVRHTHWKDSVTIPESECRGAGGKAATQAHQLMAGHKHADYVLLPGGEFPVVACMRTLLQAGYDGWHSLEWEKMWHPELFGPEIALPLFPRKIREIWTLAGGG